MGPRSQRPVWLGEDHRGWDHIRVHVQVVLDERVDPYAFAVYCALAKHAETGNGQAYPSTDTVAAYFGISERTVRRSVEALERLGYLRVERETGKASNYFLLPPPPAGQPRTEGPGSGPPTPDRESGAPRTVSPPTPDCESDELEPGTENQEPLALSSPPATDSLLGFPEFWTTYPARNGKKLGRAKAEDRWRRLSMEDRRAAWRGAVHYAEASTGGLAGAMDAFRWLRDRCWEDWQEPAVPDRRGRPTAADGLSPEARAVVAARYAGGHPRTGGGRGLPSGGRGGADR